MSEFVDHVLELMARWAPVRARRMFGGRGLYRETRMFALIADDTLYLKVDEVTRARFAAAGSAPFVYEGGGRRIKMSYWRAPAACLDDTASMSDWCALAWEAAWRSASKPVRVAQPAQTTGPAREDQERDPHVGSSARGTHAAPKPKARRRPRR